MPVADEKCPAGYRLEQQVMLFPHRIMTYLFNDCGLEIPIETIHNFWDCALEAKEVYAKPESRDRVPVGFYGDSAQLVTAIRKEKMTCFFL